MEIELSMQVGDIVIVSVSWKAHGIKDQDNGK
jgi:hypothetical protein